MSEEGRAKHPSGSERMQRAYGVPAKRGKRVTYKGRPARITSCDSQYLRLRFDGDKRTSPFPFHPLYEIDYLDGVDRSKFCRGF